MVGKLSPEAMQLAEVELEQNSAICSRKQQEHQGWVSTHPDWLVKCAVLLLLIHVDCLERSQWQPMVGSPSPCPLGALAKAPSLTAS